MSQVGPSLSKNETCLEGDTSTVSSDASTVKTSNTSKNIYNRPSMMIKSRRMISFKHWDPGEGPVNEEDQDEITDEDQVDVDESKRKRNKCHEQQPNWPNDDKQGPEGLSCMKFQVEKRTY